MTAGAFCKEVATHHGVTVEFEQDQVPVKLPETVSLNLLRVLQEALANAVKHSGASRYSVSWRGIGDQLQLEVRDDGRGFDVAATMAVSGLGLVSMQERVGLVNGHGVIESSPGSGTKVRATVPLDGRGSF